MIPHISGEMAKAMAESLGLIKSDQHLFDTPESKCPKERFIVPLLESPLFLHEPSNRLSCWRRWLAALRSSVGGTKKRVERKRTL